MDVSRNPLDFVLKLSCDDLCCYGESYVLGDDGKMTFRRWYSGETSVAQTVLEFAATAGTETYDSDVGIPGAASVEGTYKIRTIKDLVDDKYYFNSGGPRLAASADLFHTVVTIPLRKLPWSKDVERLHLSSINLASCLRYRPTELIGVVVLYLVKPPKLASELQRYLDSLVHCASPLIDMFTERDRYLRRVAKGGNKWRRLRRAILASARAGRKLPSSQDPPTVTVSTAEKTTVDNGGSPDGTVDSAQPKYRPLDVEAGSSERDTNNEVAKRGAANRPTQFEQLVNAGMTLSRAYLEKYLGGKVSLPPRVDWRLSYVAWVGCFVTIACWQVMTDAINEVNDWRGVINAFSLPGSFGALCTIVFALPSVPLAQPRIIFLAHTYSMTVSVILTYIFPQYRYVWLQKALAVAFTVGGMAKFGILNPPAGAVSLAMLTYANSPTFSNPGLLFLIVSTYIGCTMCVVVGLVWHNLFTGRTYPLYW
jgi:hypothetical protein